MVHRHPHRCEEGTATPLPRQEAEKIWHGPLDTQKFYSCTIESILTGCMATWYDKCTLDSKVLKRVVQTAQYITVAKLPAIQDLYIRRCQRKAKKIAKDSSHPSHRLFTLLPSGKWYGSIGSWTIRLRDSTGS
jgi:hypothetical protein